MKIFKTANYIKTAGMVPGENQISYFVRAVERNVDKGFEMDVVMELAGVPINLQDQVQQQLQTTSFESTDEGFSGWGNQSTPSYQQPIK